jgi:release factor glutamine methyltransferase
MNIRDALAYGRGRLEDSSLSPHLDARLLLQHVLQEGHTYLVAHDEQPLAPDQAERYRSLLDRAAQGEPIPYLTGQAPFYGRDYIANPAVLIPRSETELLVDAALAWAEGRGALDIVDVGTGSGCVAVTLALELPTARVAAVDISLEALSVARENAARHGVLSGEQAVHFYHGSLLEPVPVQPDLIVANLPYIAEGEWTMLDDGVKWYEPVVALKGGADGLDLVRQLLAQALTRLRQGGAIFLEIGWQQGTAARLLAQSFFPQALVNVQPDYAGLDRIVAIETDKQADDETNRAL